MSKVFILNAVVSRDPKYGFSLKYGNLVDYEELNDVELEKMAKEMDEWIEEDTLVKPAGTEFKIEMYAVTTLEELQTEYQSYNTGKASFEDVADCHYVRIENVNIELKDYAKLSFDNKSNEEYRLDAYIVNTDRLALDIVIWNAEASEIMGLSYPEFKKLNEDAQSDKIELLKETEYTVYLETKVKDVNKKTVRTVVRKIEQ